MLLQAAADSKQPHTGIRPAPTLGRCHKSGCVSNLSCNIVDQFPILILSASWRATRAGSFIAIPLIK